MLDVSAPHANPLAGVRGWAPGIGRKGGSMEKEMKGEGIDATKEKRSLGRNETPQLCPA